LLVADGWRVVGATRSADKAPLLRGMGVEPVVVDAYDAARLRGVVAECQPQVVIHQSRHQAGINQASTRHEVGIKPARTWKVGPLRATAQARGVGRSTKSGAIDDTNSVFWSWTTLKTATGMVP